MPLASATSVMAESAALRAEVAAVLVQKPIYSPPHHPAAASEPRQLGAWLLDAAVAEGVRSQVFRAQPAKKATPGINRPDQNAYRYVLKLLRPNFDDDPLAVAQIRQEAQVGRCVAHRHVVSVVAAHAHRAPFYVVMPHIAGRNVATLIESRGPLPTPLALWIARQTAEGLEALHTAGYLHGDMKPANLLFSSAGHVTIVDLSTSRRLNDEPTLESPAFIGTPHYVAPEIFAGRVADRRADVYSLGITLFEMLCGRLPIRSDDLSTIAAFKRDGAMPGVRLFAPQVSLNVAELVRQMTARDPIRRPQTAREVAQSIVRLEIATLAEQIPA